MKKYTVYKITNLINNKHYIGVHYTSNPNDSYYGSGVAIRNAIKLHGKENFRKDVLLITENKEEAYLKEAELTSDFSKRDTYNMRLGGVGGFTSENARKGAIARNLKYPNLSKETVAKNILEKKGIFGASKEQLSQWAKRSSKNRKRKECNVNK